MSNLQAGHMRCICMSIFLNLSCVQINTSYLHRQELWLLSTSCLCLPAQSESIGERWTLELYRGVVTKEQPESVG